MLVLLIITMVTLLTILVHHTHTHPHINTHKKNSFAYHLLIPRDDIYNSDGT